MEALSPYWMWKGSPSCMCLCMHGRVCGVYVRVHGRVCVCMDVCVSACAWTCVCLHVHGQVCVCVCMDVCVCVCWVQTWEVGFKEETRSELGLQ